jgi:hypothetical protein
VREQDIANNNIEEPNIVSRSSIKNAAYEVSKTRTEKTLFAEYPNLKPIIMAFENKKAEHDLSSLCDVWGIEENESLSRASSLAEIGFFDLRASRNEKLYKIPFIYRSYLKVVQGKAY